MDRVSLELLRDLHYDEPQRRSSQELALKMAEECGEVARALRKDRTFNLEEELGDVLSALLKLARREGISLEDIIHTAARKRQWI